MNPFAPHQALARLAIGACLLLIVTACGTSLEVESGESSETDSTQSTSTPATDPVEVAPGDEPTPVPEATATPEPTATPTPIPGELMVNDTDVVGTVGDELLSLVEAVQLANGRLTVAELSDTETEFVSGEPGDATPDTITVIVGDGVEIVSPGGDLWLVELFGNSGDTVIGGGAVLTGGGSEPGVSHNILLVGSPNVTIEGLAFRGVTQAIGLESAGMELEGVTIRDNVFIDNVIHDITVQNSITGGGFSNLTIVGNGFDVSAQLSDLRRFVVVQGANVLNGQLVEDTFIRGLTIENNAMTATADSVQVCMSISGGFADFAVTGEATGATIEEVSVVGNTLAGCNTGLLLAGGHAEQTGATLTDNSITGVVLSNNNLTVGETAIAIRGGFVEPAPASFQFAEPVSAQLTGNTVSGVSVDNTVISAYNTALSLVAGEFAVPGDGVAEANTIAEFDASEVVIIEEVNLACAEAADLGDHATGNILDMSCAGIGG